MKTRMESDSILEKFEVDKFETFFNFLPFKTNDYGTKNYSIS